MADMHHIVGAAPHLPKEPSHPLIFTREKRTHLTVVGHNDVSAALPSVDCVSLIAAATARQ